MYTIDRLLLCGRLVVAAGALECPWVKRLLMHGVCSKRERLFTDQDFVRRDLGRLQYLSHALVAVCISKNLFSAIEL